MPKLHKVPLSLLIILVLLTTIFGQAHVIGATSDSTVSPTPSISTMPNVSEVVYWRPGGFWILNPVTLEERFFFAYDPPLGSTFVGIVRPEANLFYIAEKERPPHGFQDRLGRILQLDIVSGVQTVIWQGLNLLDFALSPQFDKAIVSSLKTYTEALANRPDSQYCILTLSSGECDPVDDVGLSPNFIWVDNNRLLYRQRSDDLYLLDVDTLERQALPLIEEWNFGVFELIPRTHTLFINADSSDHYNDNYFVTLDLDTMYIVQLPFRPQHNFRTVGISPNGRYVFYTNGPSFGFEMLDLETGVRFNFTIPYSRGFVWLENSAGVVIANVNPSESVNTDATWSITFIKASDGKSTILGNYTLSQIESIRLIPQVH